MARAKKPAATVRKPAAKARRSPAVAKRISATARRKTAAPRSVAPARARTVRKPKTTASKSASVDKYLKKGAGIDTAREKEIGQHIGYRYDVNLLPDYNRITPFLKKYIEAMGWKDLNWLEDVHMGYEEGHAAVFDRNINGWVRVPKKMKLPNNQQDRDMLARELLVKFQMSDRHPLVQLREAYRKF